VGQDCRHGHKITASIRYAGARSLGDSRVRKITTALAGFVIVAGALFPFASIGSAQVASNAPSSPPTRPLFRGPASVCDGDNFAGHLPSGFVCRGYGTGLGICLEVGGKRAVTYEINPEYDQYCHLDWISLTNRQLQQSRSFLACKGPVPDCATKSFSQQEQDQ
jgi:hypothetical protein